MTENPELPEIEIRDDSEEEIIPYKYSITSYGADYPVDSLVKRLNNNVIFIPAFQRGFVWSLSKSCRFIESLLLGLPVPGIFLAKEAESGRLLVIDGQQRLKSLEFFYNGVFQGKEFKLVGVQKQFEGKTYKTLDDPDRLRLDDSIIHATIVQQDQPENDQSSIFHIFERLNTGGMLLQAQEIRACIYQGEFNELLHHLNHNDSWREIFGREHKRLKDQELILRFFALYNETKKYERPMKEFLNDFMWRNRHLQIYKKDFLSKQFKSTIEFIRYAIGISAFRLERAINAAAYDAVMVGVARRLSQSEINDTEKFVQSYESLLASKKFNNVVRTATSDVSSVHKRIELATNAFNNIQ